jgi:hypothetical protein
VPTCTASWASTCTSSAATWRLTAFPPDRLIHVRLRNASAERILREVVADLSHRLDYQVESGVLLIGDRDRLDGWRPWARLRPRRGRRL